MSDNITYRQLSASSRESVLRWWKSLEHDKGSRSKIKRGRNLSEIAIQEKTCELSRYLPWISVEALATISGSLSHIRSGVNDKKPFCKKLAFKNGGNSVFSKVKFQILLDSRNWEDFYVNLKKAINILDNNVNPLLIADLIVCWDKEVFASNVSNGIEDNPKFWMSKDYYV